MKKPLPVSIGLVEYPVEQCSGPLWLRGGIALISADGFKYEVRNRMTLLPLWWLAKQALLRRHVCVDQIQGDELRVPGPSLNDGSRKTEQNASSIIYDRQFGLSGSPSQFFETDDGLKLSSKIRGSFASEYVVDLVNCMATGSLQGNVISSAWSRCELIRSCSSRYAYVRDT